MPTVERLQRHAVDQRADADLRERRPRRRRARAARRAAPDPRRCREKRSRSSSPLPLVVKLKSRRRGRSRRRSRRRRCARTHASTAARCVGAALRRRRAARRERRARTATPQASASSAGTTNADAPARVLDQKPRSTTAASATPRLPARPLTPIVSPGRDCALDEHRNADRVVDRRERAHQRQRGRELPGRAVVSGDQQRRRAHAEEEHEHHPAPSPEVAEAARRQRAQTEQRERAHAVGHQVLPAREAEVGGDRANGRREDQQEHVVDRVRHVEQQCRGAGLRWRGHGIRGITVRVTRPPSACSWSASDCGISMPSRAALAASARGASPGSLHAGVLRHLGDQRLDALEDNVAAGERFRVDDEESLADAAADCPRRRRTSSPRTRTPRPSAR